jgi:hypothetical protein
LPDQYVEIRKSFLCVFNLKRNRVLYDFIGKGKVPYILNILHVVEINTFQIHLRNLIKEGLRSYFQDNQETPISDADLKDYLLYDASVDNLPLPQFPPYFTADGLAFVYQQYEIAPYAAGMPSFTIPYDDIRPLLTDEAACLIPQKR